MSGIEISNESNAETAIWSSIVAKYHYPQIWRSLWQFVNSVIPYFITWYLMYRSLSISYWLTLGLSVLAAGFLTRIFIIFHDCGHQSFFKQNKLNGICGWITGVLTFTPFEQWRHEHAVHHATSGDLDRRGAGAIWTLTVQEYLESSDSARLHYRIYRNPCVMFGIGALFYFLIKNRFTSRPSSAATRRSVYWTNIVDYYFF